MKNKFTFLFLFVFGLSFGQITQTKRIQFSYDTAGNQIQRVICTNCAAKNANYKNENDITDNDLQEENKVLYYPNPVLEELYIKCENIDDNKVLSIELYTMNGQLLKQFTVLNNDELAKINFRDYPAGYYNVLLKYSNGEKKDLKIIKQ